MGVLTRTMRQCVHRLLSNRGSTRGFASTNLFCDAACPPAAVRGGSTPILIEGGTLIDGNSAPRPNTEGIMVVGDRIVMGRDAKVEGDVQRIDATGMHILPGLIDAH